MNFRYQAAMCSTVVALLSFGTAVAQDITEFTNGYLTFTNDNPALYYRVEFRPNLTGPEGWNGDYYGLKNIRTNATSVTVPIGIFYRVVGSANPIGIGTAEAGDILSPKTIFMNGAEITGTMPNRTGHVEAQGISLSRYTLLFHPQPGYYSGDVGNSVAFTDEELRSSNIRSGVSIFGVGGSVIEANGTAADSHVLSGQTFSRAGAANRTGTMPNRGTVNITPGTSAQTIQQGYHSGSGSVAGSPHLLAGNIKSGVSIFGVAGSVIESTGSAADSQVLSGQTFSRAGAANRTGTMPNRTGDVTAQSRSVSGTTLRFRPQPGYYAGTTDNSVQLADANFTADNIRSGVSVFGRTGTLTPASGNAGPEDVRDGRTFSNDDGAGTGTMPYYNRHVTAQSSEVSGTTLRFRPQSGYYSGTIINSVSLSDANFTAENIRTGVSIFGVTGTSPRAGVPKTAQTTTYRSGDDGHLRKGVAWPSPRFTDHGNTVTDNLTGLMWAKNANLPGGYRTWEGAIDYCNGMNAGAGTYGYTDWRLPNVREMQSLINYARSNPALPAVHPFTGVQSAIYWSSSTSADHTGHAWYVSLYYGSVNRDFKTHAHYVWPVRGGQ